MIKVARVATVPFSLLGSRNLLRDLSDKVDLTVICSDGDYLDEIESLLKKPIVKININRKINIFSDLWSVWIIFKFFRNNQFDIAHSNTPKGGIVCAIASFLARVPVRVHTFTGQRWATMKGVRRLLLKTIDRIICILSTEVYADSESQIDFLRENKIVMSSKISCVSKGGFAGVDLNRFDEIMSSVKKRKSEAFLIGYVGRVVKEKGVETLLSAFSNLKKNGLKAELHLIGPLEEDLDPLSPFWMEYIKSDESVIYHGFMARPENEMKNCDILCLPSWREGFPMVVLESAACKIPSIVSRIPGNIDTIVENKTGLAFELENVGELQSCIKKLYDDYDFRLRLGENAYYRVKSDFTDEIFLNFYLGEYQRLYEESI